MLKEAPKFMKSKTPSKSQAIMDGIKASIEADKLKPKKEIKSKVLPISSGPLFPKRIVQEGTQFAVSHPKPTLKRTDSIVKRPALAPRNDVASKTKKFTADNRTKCQTQPKEGEFIQYKLDRKAASFNAQEKFDLEMKAFVDKKALEIQQMKETFEAERKELQEKIASEQELNIAEHSLLRDQLDKSKHIIETMKAKQLEMHEKEKCLLEKEELLSEINILNYSLMTKDKLLVEAQEKVVEIQHAKDSACTKDDKKKLAERVDGLTKELNQQREIRKIAAQQLEDARRELKNYKDGYENLLRDNEILRHRLTGAGNETASNSLLYTTANESIGFHSPSRLKMDSPSRMASFLNSVDSKASPGRSNVSIQRSFSTNSAATLGTPLRNARTTPSSQSSAKRNISLPRTCEQKQETQSESSGGSTLVASYLGAGRRVDLNPEEVNTSTED